MLRWLLLLNKFNSLVLKCSTFLEVVLVYYASHLILGTTSQPRIELRILCGKLGCFQTICWPPGWHNEADNWLQNGFIQQPKWCQNREWGMHGFIMIIHGLYLQLQIEMTNVTPIWRWSFVTGVNFLKMYLWSKGE